MRLDASIDTISVPAAMAAPLALMMHELATNAVRHAFPGERSGRVCITAARQNETLRFVVEDDGVGVGSGPANPAGFGRSLVDMVVRQMRGTIAYGDAAPGTRVEITIPLDAHPGAV